MAPSVQREERGPKDNCVFCTNLRVMLLLLRQQRREQIGSEERKEKRHRKKQFINFNPIFLIILWPSKDSQRIHFNVQISCAVWDTTSIFFSIHCKPVTCLLVHSGSACEIGKVDMLYLSGVRAVFFIQQINVKLRFSSLGLLDCKIETENQSCFYFDGEPRPDVISCDVAVPIASNIFNLKMKRVLGVYVHVLSTCKSSITSGHCSCWFLPCF